MTATRGILAATPALLLSLWVSSASAQAFALLLDKVDRLESRLDSVQNGQNGLSAKVESVTRAQQRELAALRGQLEETPTLPMTALQDQVASLGQRIDQMAVALEARPSENAQPAAQVEMVNGLAGDLRDLVTELRQTITQAQAEPEPDRMPLSISGFGDLRYGQTGRHFETGQVEVDLEAMVDERLGLELAIARGDEGFELGVFTVDIPLWGQKGHLFASRRITRAGLIVGQFDVPFGLDWQEYASPERSLVSTPLAIESLLTCWNDYGIQGYLEVDRLRTALFVVNGFSSEEGEPGVAVHLAAGGRQALRLLPGLEVGASYAGFHTREGGLAADLAGVDGQLELGHFSCRGEYLLQRHGLLGKSARHSSGYYLRGQYRLGRLFAVGRVDRLRLASASDQARVSVGGGCVFVEGWEIRLELQPYGHGISRTGCLQTVVAF